MIDFSELANIAASLVAENGREVTFIRFAQGLQDPDKPWLGPADPRDDVDAEAIVDAVFVPAGGGGLGFDVSDNDLLRRAGAICIVAPGTIDPPFDLTTAHEIIDEGGVRRRITTVEVLRPNTATLLYVIGVDR